MQPLRMLKRCVKLLVEKSYHRNVEKGKSGRDPGAGEGISATNE